MCYILEIYASTSLEAQHTKHFPSQVWAKVKSAQKMLKNLGEKWVWSDKEMKKSDMEAPSKIIDRLKNEGRYEPKLKKNQIIKRQQEMRISGLLLENQTVEDLFFEKEQVVPLCGELIMEEATTDEIIEDSERILSRYAQSIYEE